MERERVEDTYQKLMEVAEDISLCSRNYNDELIGIDYYKQLDVLTHEQLRVLVQAWHRRWQTCKKEKLASQFMVVQILGLISLAMWIAWLSGGWFGAIASIAGVVGMIKMIEDDRVRKAKRNLADAERVYRTLASLAKTSLPNS